MLYYNKYNYSYMEEIWKVWKILPRVKYEISNHGNVKRNGIILDLSKHIKNNEYISVGWFYVHKAVAKLFCDNPNNYKEVDHIDGNKQNNNYTNLEWVTHKENMRRYYESDRYLISQERRANTYIKKKNERENKRFVRCYYYDNKIFYSQKELAKYLNMTISEIRHFCFDHHIYKNCLVNKEGTIINNNMIK